MSDPLDLDLQALGFPDGATPLTTGRELLAAAATPVGLAGWKLGGALAATALLSAGLGAGALHATFDPEIVVETVVETITVTEVVTETVVERPLVEGPTRALAGVTCDEPVVDLESVELVESVESLEETPDEPLDFDLAWLDGLPSPTIPTREEPTAELPEPELDPATWAARLGAGTTLGPQPDIAATATVVRYGAERALGRPTLTGSVGVGTAARGFGQHAAVGAGLTRDRFDATWLVAARRHGTPEGPALTPSTGPEVALRLADRIRIAGTTQLAPPVEDRPVGVLAGLSVTVETDLR